MDDTITITMLGRSGSGKSNGLGAIFHMLIDNPHNGFVMTASGQTEQERLHNIHALRSHADISFQFVDRGTMQVTTLPSAFGLQQSRRPRLIDVPMIDYPGGMLQRLMRENSEEITEFLERIKDTHVLMLFADANYLLEADDAEGIERARQNIAVEINSLFNVLFTQSGPFLNQPRTVLLTLTKCDSTLVQQKLGADNWKQLMQRAQQVFAPTISFCREYEDWKFAIIPCSACGNGNAVTEQDVYGNYISRMRPDTTPQPYGFEEAFLYGIMTELDRRLNSGAFSFQEKELMPKGVMNFLQKAYIKAGIHRYNAEQFDVFMAYAKALHGYLDPLIRGRNTGADSSYQIIFEH